MHLSIYDKVLLQTEEKRNALIQKTLLIMKLMAVFLFAACLQVSARGYSQNISLSVKDAKLQTVLDAIRKQSGYKFFFNETMLRNTRPVTIDVKNASVETVLQLCFSDQPLTYAIIQKTVVIKDRDEAKNRTGTSGEFQQPVDVHGHVTDSAGNPLAGASIIVKGRKKGTMSDSNGDFYLAGVQNTELLIISFTGYESKEMASDGNSVILVSLRLASGVMQDVVVNKGYYKTTRRLNTGAVSTVSSEEIADQPVSNPLSALQGRVAGVEITSSSGSPGSTIDIKIRGLNTNFAATAYPLFIIDGVAAPGNYINSLGYIGISPLNSVNPGDIESIAILKDADATAVYGSRGANGVVLITTKKGKSGATRVDVDIETGFSKAAHLDKTWLTTPEYLAVRRQAFTNDGIIPDPDSAPDLFLWDQHATTDWQKKIIGNTSAFSNLQATLSGGDERVRYLLSVAYNHQTGIQWGNNYDNRANMHLNIENNSKDKRFQMSTNFTYSDDDNSYGNYPLYDIAAAPNMPLYDSTGAIYRIPGNTAVVNPLYTFYQYTNNKTNNFIANTKLRYSILRNLDASVSVGYTKMQQSGYQVFPSKSLDPDLSYPIYNQAGFSNNYVTTRVAEPQLDYNTHISKGKLQALAGGTWQKTETGVNTVIGANFSSEVLLKNIGAASEIISKQSGTTLYKYESLFGRINYNWMDKYVVNASFRQDGSSRFGNGYKFGNFWAVGGSWLFSNEGFFKDAIKVIDFGKLRASYGIVGNDQIGDYQYLSFYGPTTYNYNGTSGIYSIQVSNNNYRWEETRKLDLGFELNAFKSRLSVTIDWFRNRSGNLLTLIPLSAQSGYSFYTGNLPALVENKGWEFTLNTVNIKTRDFKWSSSFNITFPKNTLIAFPGLENSVYSDAYQVGKSIRLEKEYKFAGIDPKTGLPLFYKHDGTVTDGTTTGGGPLSIGTDYQAIGNTDPNFFGGIGNILSYKQIELNLFFQFSNSHTGNSFLFTQYYPTGSLTNTLRSFVTNAWQQSGNHALYPALTINNGTYIGSSYANFTEFSSANYVDNSYLRLKTLALSYTLPVRLASRLKLSSIKVFLRGQNLLTFTKYIGFDPESTYAVPVLKTITFGLNAAL